MKPIVVFLILSLSLFAQAQPEKAPTLKSILLEKLRTTHNVKDWFVDANTPSPDSRRSRPAGPMGRETTPLASSPTT